MGTSVQPREASTQYTDMQIAALQVSVVDVGNFEFTTMGRLHLLRDPHHIVVVEIKAGDGVIGFRMQGLFFDRNGFTIVIKLNHTKTLGVRYVVAEDRGT
ncbi:hypothetical protein D3C72_1946780 [compost metagenome]